MLGHAIALFLPLDYNHHFIHFISNFLGKMGLRVLEVYSFPGTSLCERLIGSNSVGVLLLDNLK